MYEGMYEGMQDLAFTESFLGDVGECFHRILET
jgi:hypothetical protein